MKKEKFIQVPGVVLLFAGILLAVEPNFVRSTVYKVGKDGSDADVNLTSVEYSDGMGRKMQTKTDLNNGSDRTVCTYYDELGRLEQVIFGTTASRNQ